MIGTVTAILLSVGTSAQQPATPGAATDVVLTPTNHPRLPDDISQLWMAPDRGHSHKALMTEFANGVKLGGAEVYINFSNDVVVQEPRPPNRYIVQHWNLRPGVPQRLSCVRWMFCWTEADRAESVPLGGDGYQGMVQMSSHEVSFVDGTGAPVRVTLR